MGAGKSSVGRRLAARLGIPFVDADVEIEKAAGHDHLGNLRRPRRALFPRRRDAGDRAAAGRRSAGAGHRRRRIHERRDPRGDPRQGNFGVAARHARGSQPPDQAPRRPSAAQGRRSGRRRCGGCSRSAIRSMPKPTSRWNRATCRTKPSSTKSWKGCAAASRGRRLPRRKARPHHDRAAALRRSDHRQCRARRPRLRHRDRARPARDARRADRQAPAGMQGRDRHRRDGGAPSSRRGAKPRLPAPASASLP